MGIRARTVVAVIGLTLASLSLAAAQDLGPRFAALGGTEKWIDRQYTPVPKADDAAKVAFCGQCTADDNCGSGHKCCGPSNCRQCFRVATCAGR